MECHANLLPNSVRQDAQYNSEEEEEEEGITSMKSRYLWYVDFVQIVLSSSSLPKIC